MATLKNIFKLSELKDIILVILILAFGFSYRFTGPATLDNWFGNFIVVIILVLFSILVHEIVHKLVAAKFSVLVTPKIWWSGVIVMVILLVFSGGLIVFAAPWAVAMKPFRLMKPGKPWPHVGPKEYAIIALSGPMANLGLAIIAKLLSPALGLISTKLITMNIFIAIFNLVPFFTILPIMFFQWAKLKPLEAPYVEGEFVFFGSRPLWIFVFIFTLVTGASLIYFNVLISIVLAFILAAAIWVAWHWFLEPAAPGGWQQEVVPGIRREVMHWRTKK